MSDRAFHQFTKFSVLVLVNDKKNKERQSADSGEVKRITGTTTQPALALLTLREGADRNCTTVHTKSSMLRTRPTD